MGTFGSPRAGSKQGSSSEASLALLHSSASSSGRPGGSSGGAAAGSFFNVFSNTHIISIVAAILGLGWLLSTHATLSSMRLSQRSSSLESRLAEAVQGDSRFASRGNSRGGSSVQHIAAGASLLSGHGLQEPTAWAAGSDSFSQELSRAKARLDGLEETAARLREDMEGRSKQEQEQLQTIKGLLAALSKSMEELREASQAQTQQGQQKGLSRAEAVGVGAPSAALPSSLQPPTAVLPPPPEEGGEGAVTISPAVAAAAEGLPALILGIPTVAREDGSKYLLQTLHYIEQQALQAQQQLWQAVLKSGGGEKARAAVEQLHLVRPRVVVLNNNHDKGVHPAFQEAMARYCGQSSQAESGAMMTMQQLLSTPRCRAFRWQEHVILLPKAAAEEVPPGDVAAASSSSLSPGSSPSAAAVFAFAINGKGMVMDGDDQGTANFPGFRVRQQTRDVISLLEVVQALFQEEGEKGKGGPTSAAQSALLPIQHGAGKEIHSGLPALELSHLSSSFSKGIRASNAVYMFMEDDFRLCPSGLYALGYLLRKAAFYRPDWNAIRVSLGLNGALVRMLDVPVLTAYFQEHLARRPPDHLIVEWFAGETPQSSAQKRGRDHMAFKFNLLEHFGFSSSLRAQKSPIYAFCYDRLEDGVVFEVEAWKKASCGHEDIWPCSPASCLSQEAVVGKQAAEACRNKPAVAPSPAVNFEQIGQTAKQDTVQTWGARVQ